MLLSGIFFLSVIADLFLFQTSSDFRYFGILIFWFFLVKICNFGSGATFKLALLFLILLLVYFIFQRNSPLTERIATWLYLIIFFGVIQQLLELIKTRNKGT